MGQETLRPSDWSTDGESDECSMCEAKTDFYIRNVGFCFDCDDRLDHDEISEIVEEAQ